MSAPWHFLHVSEWPPELADEDGYEFDLMHPDTCGWRIEIGQNGTIAERLCGVQWEVDNIGEGDAYGNPGPGWYAVRHWSETTSFPGSAWSEVNTGVEVMSMGAFAYKEMGGLDAEDQYDEPQGQQ